MPSPTVNIERKSTYSKTKTSKTVTFACICEVLQSIFWCSLRTLVLPQTKPFSVPVIIPQPGLQQMVMESARNIGQQTVQVQISGSHMRVERLTNSEITRTELPCPLIRIGIPIELKCQIFISLSSLYY